MTKKRHPNECPTCERIPCKCVGGGGADEKQLEKDDEANADKLHTGSANSAVHNACVLSPSSIDGFDERTQVTLFNQKGELAYCTLFAETAKNSASALSQDAPGEERESNSENTSLSIGMSMSALGD